MKTQPNKADILRNIAGDIRTSATLERTMELNHIYVLLNNNSISTNKAWNMHIKVGS